MDRERSTRRATTPTPPTRLTALKSTYPNPHKTRRLKPRNLLLVTTLIPAETSALRKYGRSALTVSTRRSGKARLMKKSRKAGPLTGPSNPRIAKGAILLGGTRPRKEGPSSTSLLRYGAVKKEALKWSINGTKLPRYLVKSATRTIIRKAWNPFCRSLVAPPCRTWRITTICPSSNRSWKNKSTQQAHKLTLGESIHRSLSTPNTRSLSARRSR